MQSCEGLGTALAPNTEQGWGPPLSAAGQGALPEPHSSCCAPHTLPIVTDLYFPLGQGRNPPILHSLEVGPTAEETQSWDELGQAPDMGLL